MSTTIKSILDTVSRELTDQARTSWTLADLVGYYNSAIAAIANYRPDLFAETVAHISAAGTRQTLPSGAIKLIEVERNTGGRKIRFIERGHLDDQDPEWMTGTGNAAAEAYSHEVANPKVFWLYPGVADGVSVDVVQSSLPEQVTEQTVTAGSIAQVDDTWLTPLMDWIIYRAYMRDSDNTANSARGQLHLQAFAQYLGVKIETDSAIAALRDNKFQNNQG